MIGEGDPTPINPGGGGVVGDPYFMSPDGKLFDFPGEPGQSYLFATDGFTRVVFRIAAVPSNPLKSLVDQVVVSFPGHSVIIGLSGVTVDGLSLDRSVEAVSVGAGLVWWHTGAGGESRVDVAFGSWRVAVIQDPGTSLLLHPLSSPIREVLHLGLFLDATPPVSSALSGLFLSTGLDIVPASYLAPLGI